MSLIKELELLIQQQEKLLDEILRRRISLKSDIARVEGQLHELDEAIKIREQIIEKLQKWQYSEEDTLMKKLSKISKKDSLYGL